MDICPTNSIRLPVDLKFLVAVKNMGYDVDVENFIKLCNKMSPEIPEIPEKYKDFLEIKRCKNEFWLILIDLNFLKLRSRQICEGK